MWADINNRVGACVYRIGIEGGGNNWGPLIAEILDYLTRWRTLLLECDIKREMIIVRDELFFSFLKQLSMSA